MVRRGLGQARAGFGPLPDFGMPGADRLGVDPGRDDRNPKLAFHRLIEGGAEDDICFRIDFFANAVGGLIDLIQRHVHAAGDIDENPAGTLHRDVVQQRVGDGGFGRIGGPFIAIAFAGAHHGLAHFGHDGPDIREVEIDQAGHHHEVGNAPHARIKDVVGHRERIGEGCLLVRHPEQVLVGNDDQRIDKLLKLLNPRLREPHPVGSFKVERLGHDAHRQEAVVARGPRDNRGRARAGATAHAGRDEEHMASAQLLHDFLDRFFGGSSADFGARAGAEALGDRRAKL